MSSVAAILVAVAQSTSACDPAVCLERIASRAAVTLMDASRVELTGEWTSGGGLAGETLYLFADGSFIYSEWADVQPETVYDKGHWALSDGVLQLAPDADITWESDSDRRFLCLKDGQTSRPVLLGIDVSLQRLEELADANPGLGSGDDWLRAVAFTRRKALDLGESRKVKARVLRDAWRPDHHERSQ